MSNFLLLYASTHGTTKTIAGSIAARLRSRGHHVNVRDARDGIPSLSGYDAVVIGAPVRGGRYPRVIRRFIEQRRVELGQLQTGFFSVSMSAASGGKDAALPRFLQEARWGPDVSISLAGALHYTRYNPLLRLVMRHMSRKAGQTTDASRDHWFTDWKAVADFADALEGRLHPPPWYPSQPIAPTADPTIDPAAADVNAP